LTIDIETSVDAFVVAISIIFKFLHALSCIQDNYTFAQPGIQMKVNALRELIQRIDGEYVIPTKHNLLNYKAMTQGKNTYSQKLENTVLASNMFVSGFRPWLENVASLSSL